MKRPLALAVVLGVAAPVAAQPSLLDRALAGPDARWPRRPLLDVATAMIHVPEARARTTSTGRGTAVCVIDTGIDLWHPDFRDAFGRSRVSWLLDLNGAPRPDVPADLAALQDEFGGAVWDAAAIAGVFDPALAPRDTYGHGTAVASAAAGDDLVHGGVAPDAALIVVAALRDGVPGFLDEDIAAGAAFCARVGPPGRTVIVISAGGHDGAHDGTEPLELALAEVVRAGTPVVVAAGNDGNVSVHASALLAPREAREILLRVPSPPRGATLPHHLALVIATRDGGELRLAIETPEGARTPPVALGERLTFDTPDGRVEIDATRPARANGDRPIYVLLAGGGALPASLRGGTWRLHARGPARLDAWIAGEELGNVLTRARFDGPEADSRESVTIPATSPEVIAVGATASRVMYEGRAFEVGAVEGEPAPYTARGPTRVGVAKPDVVAPGGFVVVALSSAVRAGDPRNVVAGNEGLLAQLRVGTDRIVLRGTSLAAPLAAGTLALALEIAPSDDVDRRLLMATAVPFDDGAAWSPSAGAGVLDAYAFLGAREARSDAAVDPGSLRVSATRTHAAAGEPWWIVVRALDETGFPLARADVEVQPEGAAPIRADLRAGIAWIPASFRSRAVVSVDGVSAGTIHVRPDDPAFHPLGGGCAVGGVPLPLGQWNTCFAFLVILVVVGNRRLP